MTAAGAERPQGTVYMLHFDQPYKHARHYTGWASDLAARLAEHAAGRGARLTQVVKSAGLEWQLARTWPGTRATERAIKDRRNAPRLCPVCTPHPQPGTGHHASPAPPGDRAARREAAAFLAGVRAAETWAAPVIAAGRLDEARQMLALDYHPADPQDAERQRGFTAQLGAMIRTADPGPARATKEAGEPPAGKGTPLSTTREAGERAAEEFDADAGQYEQEPDSDQAAGFDPAPKPASGRLQGAALAHTLITRGAERGHSSEFLTGKYEELLGQMAPGGQQTPAERDWLVGFRDEAEGTLGLLRDLERADAEMEAG